MNFERLLAHYERIADAPDAVSRLRRFILDLAVRGKLVPQDSNDEPTQFPYPEGLGRKGAVPIEPPYALPSAWRWVRIGDQLTLLNGMAFKPTDWLNSGIRIVRIQNLNNPSAPFNCCDPSFARENALISNGSFLISWSGTPGTSFGAFIWDRGPAVLNQHIFRCDFKTDAFSPEYLRLAINGRLDEMIEKAHGGVGLQHITKGKLEAMLIGLPPQSEQHRIVAKVDELMALCDRLEAARADREATRDRLSAASFARLDTPDPDPAIFAKNTRFALEVLPALTARTDQIKHLRQITLNLAVRGKLVPQVLTDEPIKLRATSRDPRPDEIPGSWRYTRLHSLLSEDTRNGYSRRPDEAANGTPILRISAGTIRRDGVVAEEEHKLISGISAEDREQYGLRAGDLLACRFNGNKAFVGRLTIFKDYLGIRPIYPDKLIRIRVVPELVLATYLRLASDTDVVRAEIEAACATTVGNWGISATNLKQIRLPLPPLAEQRRIVAKVDELMVICDRLEASLVAGDASRSRLLDALLAEALAPAREVAEAA